MYLILSGALVLVSKTHLPLETLVGTTDYIEANLCLVLRSPNCITAVFAVAIKEIRILLFKHQTRNTVKRWLREHRT